MTTQQDQATVIQSAYQANVAKIRANLSLSGDGKRAALAKLYTASTSQLDALLAEQTDSANTRAALLERTLFGLPASAPTADVVSYRDALDRVSSIDLSDQQASARLNALYKSAQLSGDLILGKAVLSAAFDARYVDLINRYIEDHPTQDAAITELWETRVANRIDPIALFIFRLTKPDELASMDDISIRALGNASTTASTATSATPTFTTASY